MRICPYCGCYLDPQEICDCRKELNMEFIGTFKEIGIDWNTGEKYISFIYNDSDVPTYVEKLRDKKLRITAVKYKIKRSLDANAYMWQLLNEMAAVLKTDKDSLYLEMLSKYGQFTHVVIKESAVETFKKQWKEYRELGSVIINGKKGIQLQCYYGSSTYSTEEMAQLIDGIVTECNELGIATMTPDDLKHMKEMWGK